MSNRTDLAVSGDGSPPHISLTESYPEIREGVRSLCAQFPGEYWREKDRERDYPNEFVAALTEAGYLAALIPEMYGGSGLPISAAVAILEEIHRSGCNGAACHAQMYIMGTVLRHGSTEQKQRYLPKLISGKHVGALAMSETGSGSDVISLKLSAEKRGDLYVLNGTKMWITNGPDADVLVIYARTEPDSGPHGITAFIVERSYKGFHASPKLDKLGMRGSNTSELVFEDCEVPEENVLGLANAGVSVLMSGLDYERVVLSGGPLGIMQACLDVVIPYVHERKQFGQPIGQFQLMQAKLADMYTDLNACRAYVYAVATACDRGETTRKDAAGAILYSSERATAMTLNAIQCLGGNGYTNEFPTGRLLRDAKLFEIGGGTSEIRRMLIGRELFNETE